MQEFGEVSFLYYESVQANHSEDVGCNKLQVVPTNYNYLEPHDIYSSVSKVFPDITRNVENLWRGGPSFGGHWNLRRRLDVVGRLTHVPESVTKVDVSSSGIERIPTYIRPQILDDVVGPRLTHVPQSLRKLDLSGSGIERLPGYVSALYRLQTLNVANCRKLMSMENLPSSLKSLQANNCVSLERVEFSMLQQDSDSIRELMFHNCLRLDKEARRVIINRRYVEYACLPGKEVPAEFTHKAAGNSIIISPRSFSTASSRFQVCFLLSPIKENPLVNVTCYLRNKEDVHINQVNYLTKLNPGQSPQVRTQHLFILGGDLSRQQNRSPRVDVNTSEIRFEFTCSDNHKIIECGVRILKEEVSIGGNSNNNTDGDDDEAGYVKIFQGSIYISCWRWLMKLYPGGRL